LDLAANGIIKTEMNCSASDLVRRTFLIQYGYAPNLAENEVWFEFQSRYDRAQALLSQNADFRHLMLVIDGMAEDVGENEAFWEREIRKRKIQRLCDENGLSALELDLLIEEYVAHLEVRWIRDGEYQCPRG
jgi:hypothetical protein